MKVELDMNKYVLSQLLKAAQDRWGMLSPYSSHRKAVMIAIKQLESQMERSDP